MSYIIKKHISTGVTWVAIEEAELFICCGCPADAIKHLKNAGVVQSYEIEGNYTESGPNAILLSDTLIQNGQLSSLAEYPILHMLYMQGMNLPNHPNFKKIKPLLIGHQKQITMQLDYVTIGNHGLGSVEEIIEGGISVENAEKIFATKLHYTGGSLKSMEDLVDSCVLEENSKEIKNGVLIERLGLNVFEISYKNEKIKVDLNVEKDDHFSLPYNLPFKKVIPGKFSITHSGEGNGWDPTRPCMASLVHFNNKVYLIDAGPNILKNLSYLGLGLSEIDGIFLSHIHDDHFAGITELLNVERKLNFYATKLIRITAERKLKALMNSEYDLIQVAFNCHDLLFDEWNDLDGLEVMPVYSPHTVETSTFNFKVKKGNSYKTYTHLSDTINLKEFKAIVNESPTVFTDEDITYVKQSYLSTVNLKKVDVGGGSIHGHLSDYKDDKSEVLVLAHTDGVVTSEKENFINVEFGDTQHLIESNDMDYLKSNCFDFLKRYFNMLSDEEVLPLSRGKMRLFKPGEVILTKEEKEKIYLIVNGIVSYQLASKKELMLDAGNFIGYSRRYFKDILPEEYSAWSYVHGLELDEGILDRYIAVHGLRSDISDRISMMVMLRNSELVNHMLSNSIMNKISKSAEVVRLREFQITKEVLQNNLFIVKKGVVKTKFDNRYTAKINKGEHFGGLELVDEYRINQQFKFDDLIEAVKIPTEIVLTIPKMLWRILELEEKRHQVSIFTAKYIF